jgi:excisionase family DNA binding protein
MTSTGLFIVRVEEVANILNVSLDYVRKLAFNDTLPFHGHPNHYRLDVVLAYKEADDIRRNKALQELVELTEEYGGYDSCIYATCRQTGECLYPDRSKDLNCPTDNVAKTLDQISEDRERLVDEARD